MKKQQSGTLMTKVIMGVLLAAVVVYLGVYLLRFTGDKLVTTPAIEFTAEDSITVVGYLVRDEETVSSNAEYIDVRVDDGEKIGTNQVLARTYSDVESLQLQKRIDELELSLEQLDSVFVSDVDPSVASTLDQEITNVILSLSRDIVAGDLSRSGDDILTLKSLVLSRSEIFSGSGDVAALRTSLQNELNSLLNSGASSSGTIYSQQSGLFTTQIDGYENYLTIDNLNNFSTSDFDTLESYQATVPSNLFGKYIFGSRWYYICLVTEQYMDIFEDAGSIRMRFVGGYTDDLTMTVESISQPDEQGRCVLILSCNRYMSETSALRRQTVDLIREQYSGIRIPKQALRVDENGQNGVYCLVGVQAQFKEVNIIHEYDDYFIVEQNSDDAYSLHVGDEIIVNAKDLYDGKVIENL